MNSRLSRMLVQLVALAVTLSILSACATTSRRVVSTTRSSRTYTVVKPRAGDSLSSLANRFLGDPRKGWVIGDFNETVEVSPERFLIVPLTPVYRGGLSADGYQRVPVLAYGAFNETGRDVFAIDRAGFAEQMRYLKDNGYTPITLAEFVRFMTFEDQIPERSVLITIDDVGQNTYEVAFDVLKSFGFPATVFVCTDLLAERQGALDWNRIREMRDAGLSIQHRTKTLRNLTRRMTGETLEDYIVAVDRELTVASLAFRAELGEEPQWFAYPYGATNEMVIELLKKNGFRGAFTLGGGAVPFFADDYRMDRITVSGDYSLDQFVKLLDTGAAHPGGGGVIPSMQALFDPSGGDPYEAVSARFLELAKEREQAGDNMMALEYFRITGTLNRNAPGVRKSAIEVRDRVAADAVEHLVAARAARDGGNADEAVAEYLEALRHDPENAEALGELKDMMTLETGRAYEITQNDVLRRIAEREYGNSDVEILLSKINNISVAEILEPGERIVLPLLSAELLQVSEEAAKATPAVTVVHPEEPSGAGVAHAAVPVAAPVAEVPMADRIAPLVAMCKLQFANGNYETVASITDEILQMDPGHADAVEIQRASYYAMATDYYKQGSNVRAMRMLRNLPGSYKDTAARMADVQKALDDSAEPLYLQGVNAFINEDLEKAVESWELTLQANPWHKKAKQDLDKARKLLEAVRGL